MAAFVVSNPETLPQLVAMAADVSHPDHFKACWILELVLENRIRCLSPFLDVFIGKLPYWSHDSAVRPVAKIVWWCAAEQNRTGKFLTSDQTEKLSEATFQWLSSEEKVAAKAHAIRALYELGKSLPWVYPMLVPLIRKDYAQHSPAYRVAAREVLSRLRKSGIDLP